MIAYKITSPGLTATRGSRDNYKLKMGLNTTKEANCARNGFHCAANPLDCLTYYSSLQDNEIYLVEAGGDIDEDSNDSKISCTELNIIRRLSVPEFIAASVLYAQKYPYAQSHRFIKENKGSAESGFCIVKGKNPLCKALKIGDVLGFLKISETGIHAKVFVADGEKIKPGVWYTINGEEYKK